MDSKAPKFPVELHEREGLFVVTRRGYKVLKLAEGQVLTKQDILEIHASLNWAYKEAVTDTMRFHC